MYFNYSVILIDRYYVIIKVFYNFLNMKYVEWFDLDMVVESMIFENGCDYCKVFFCLGV